MTTRKGRWVRLDGLSDRQLATLREDMDDWLVAKADDLPEGVGDADGVGREVEEVAALVRRQMGSVAARGKNLAKAP